MERYKAPVLLRGWLSEKVGKGQVQSGHRLGAGGYRAEGTQMGCTAETALLRFT